MGKPLRPRSGMSFSAVLTAVKSLLGRDGVAMMQPTESGQRDNLAAIRRYGRGDSTTGSVLADSEMSAVLVVIMDIVIQQPPQVPLIKNDHVIQEISAYTANPAFGSSALPRTAKGGAYRLGTHRCHSRDNVGTELRIAIEDQEARRRLAIVVVRQN